MKTIDVDGLPEPVARAMEAVVATVREQLRRGPDRRARVALPVREGSVLTPLTREEIYADAI